MRPLLFAACLALAACDTYHYVAGTLREDARKPALAVKHYEAFLASRPKDPRACEVRLRAADVYRTVFGRCEEARVHYEAAARDFPRQPVCLARAKNGLLLCPDYMPVEPGRTWVYVDSESGGRAMRQESEVAASSGVVTTGIFAGNNRILVKSERYEKADWAVWRIDKDGREPVLRYPYTEASNWTVKRGKSSVEYLVSDASATVKVKAGTFTGCVKMRERELRNKSSWKYDYYCPGVGRVKTSVGGPGYENPNTELLRFGKID
ncbi:MAG: tetratricopeptide repeat protein [Elusimicrobiota bacterium]|nr:MAG: tetratricopeptide repeat protein [Elusimicrobiota bacterium]